VLTGLEKARTLCIIDQQTENAAMEKAHSINGVNGRLFVVKNPGVRADGCFDKQKWLSESRKVKGYGAGGSMNVEIRFDDECKNGHNSFAITASIYSDRSRRMGDIEAGGCLHEEIARVFPELKDLIQWHLFDTRGPMHYPGNALYHATDWADSRYAPGEPCQWETRARFGHFPVTFKFEKRFREYLKARIEHSRSTLKTNPAHVAKFEPVPVPYVKRANETYDFGPHYTVTGDDCKAWHEAPFKSLREAQEFCDALNTYELTFERVPTDYAKSKARDLNAARSCANWPEATDEQLCLPSDELKALLMARLPAMLERFRAAIDAIGFGFEAPEKV
jgi:hypothetical protein